MNAKKYKKKCLNKTPKTAQILANAAHIIIADNLKPTDIFGAMDVSKFVAQVKEAINLNIYEFDKEELKTVKKLAWL